MRVLIVASYNRDRFAPFIVEQANALVNAGCEVGFFGVKGKGFKGYLRNLSGLKREIKAFHPDVVHAHYGLSGLLACLQREVPVVVTYHGSDINEKKVLRFSKIAMRFSAWNIFVSRKTFEIAKPKQKYTLLPCGVDLFDLQLTSKVEARKLMHLDASKKYILFSGAFDNKVKNMPLAKQSVGLLRGMDVELLELKGYSRNDVTLLMCAADVFLMTSLMEGSPQVIKEALACDCPIVSVNVGDVKERIEGIEGCYVAETREPEEIALLLTKAFGFERITGGREKIDKDGLSNVVIAQQLKEIYKSISNR